MADVTGGGQTPTDNQQPTIAGVQPVVQPMATSTGTSPWEEALDDETTADGTVGTLGGNNSPAPLDSAQGKTASFAVPQNVENSTPLNQVSADAVNKPQPNADRLQPAAPAGLGALIQPTANPATPTSSPAPAPIQNLATSSTIDSIKPPVPVSAAPQPPVAPPAVTVVAPPPVIERKPAKQGLFSFFRKKTVAEKQGSGEAEGAVTPTLQSLIPNSQVQVASPVPAPDKAMMLKGKKPLIFLIIAGVVVVLAGLIYLTESGVIGIGMEKYYGFLGIEKFWGGLGANAENALARSFVAMKNQSEFQIDGNISITIDKSVTSPITTPLVSLNSSTGLPLIQKAILAVDLSADSSSTDDTGADTSVSSGTADSSANSSSSASSSSSSSSSAATSGSTSGSAIDTTTDLNYSSLSSSTKNVAATFTGSVTDAGSQVDFYIAKPVGSQTISLKNSKDELWVKSDSVKFAANATPDKWLEYNLADLKNKSAVSETFGATGSSVYSAKGTRIKDEKVGGVYCYHYNYSSIEIGDALSSIGLNEGAIQSISGDVWIGVKDKLLRKITLHITPSPSSADTLVDVNINFSSFGSGNGFTAPSASQVIKPSATAVSDTTTAATATTTPAVTTPVAVTITPVVTAPVATTVDPYPNDTQRKADLASVKTALVAYKTAHGSYPKSSAVIKLSTAGNVLAKALVPTYIAALPSDPTSAQVYTYVSNGTTFTLSARLDNASDPAAVKVSGKILYNLKND